MILALMGVNKMWGRKRCCCKKSSGIPLGPVLIALGAGILLAYIIPYYVLIAMLGLALVGVGIWFIRKK